MPGAPVPDSIPTASIINSTEPRTLLALLLNALVTAGELDSNLQIAETWLPRSELSDIRIKPKFWLVAGQGDEEVMSRGNVTSAEIPVQCALQKLVTPSDTATIDSLVVVLDKIKTACRKYPDWMDPYTWIRTDVMKTPEGEPVPYVGLRDEGTFEAYFTVYYKTTLP